MGMVWWTSSRSSPATDLALNGTSELEVRGHAWAGDRSIERVDVSIDFGTTWISAELDSPANPAAWQDFRANVRFERPGYYEVWARATDDQGVTQPFRIAWNPKGYLNNTMHRVAVNVSA